MSQLNINTDASRDRERLDLSPELIRPPQNNDNPPSPMASPVRGPAVREEKLPVAPKSPPTLTFDQEKFERDQNTENRETDSDEDGDPKLDKEAQHRINTMFEKEFGASSTDAKINTSDKSLPPAAAGAAAAPLESKSDRGGGGTGSRYPNGHVGSNPAVPLGKIVAELRLTDAWKPELQNNWVFQVVPYTGDAHDPSEFEESIQTCCESVISAMHRAERTNADEKLEEFDTYMWRWIAEESEEYGNDPQGLENALEDVIDFIKAYCKVAGIDFVMSSQKFHEICTDVALMELTPETEEDDDGDEKMAAAPAPVAAAAGQRDKKRSAPATEPDDETDERPAKHSKTNPPSPPEDSDDADDEAGF